MKLANRLQSVHSAILKSLCEAAMWKTHVECLLQAALNCLIEVNWFPPETGMSLLEVSPAVLAFPYDSDREVRSSSA